jgi:hypothetical protein
MTKYLCIHGIWNTISDTTQAQNVFSRDPTFKHQAHLQGKILLQMSKIATPDWLYPHCTVGLTVPNEISIQSGRITMQYNLIAKFNLFAQCLTL